MSAWRAWLRPTETEGEKLPMGFRALRSLTFFIGLLLFSGAFAAIVMFGAVFNPAPYRVVVALKDLPPYSVLEPSMLGTDAQTMNSKVAARLVQEAELGSYLGGMLIEPIHAGEPLRRMAVVAPDNPAAKKRLALALSDPGRVAMVIPAEPDIVPDSVEPGDFVDVAMAVGSVQQAGDQRTAAPANSNSPATPAPASLQEAADRTVASVMPPFAKIVLQNVPVLQVQRQQVQNPNFGVGFGSDQASQQPAFVDGDLQRLVVLVPADAQEMVTFAIANGALSMTLVPHVAVQNNVPGPTFGVTWEDFKAFFRAERQKVIGGNLTGMVPVDEMLGWATGAVPGGPAMGVQPTPAAPQSMVTLAPALTHTLAVSPTVTVTATRVVTLTPAPWATPITSGSETLPIPPPAIAPGAGMSLSPTAPAPGNQPGMPLNVNAPQDFILPGLMCLVFLAVLAAGFVVLRTLRRARTIQP
jgi:Flp pilus assembly protein CpaB